MAFKALGMPVQYSALWGAALFVVAGLVVFLLAYGPSTGIKGIDGRVHKLIDLLVETESELTKVAWPGSEELSRSTTAVLVSILLLGVFLFVVDWIVTQVMGSLHVLPG